MLVSTWKGKCLQKIGAFTGWSGRQQERNCFANRSKPPVAQKNTSTIAQAMWVNVVGNFLSYRRAVPKLSKKRIEIIDAQTKNTNLPTTLARLCW